MRTPATSDHTKAGMQALLTASFLFRTKGGRMARRSRKQATTATSVTNTGDRTIRCPGVAATTTGHGDDGVGTGDGLVVGRRTARCMAAWTDVISSWAGENWTAPRAARPAGGKKKKQNSCNLAD
jgi:hypothetical protein